MKRIWLYIGIGVLLIVIFALVLRRKSRKLTRDQAEGLVIELKSLPPKIDTFFEPPLVTPDLEGIRKIVNKLKDGGWFYDVDENKLIDLTK